MTKLGLATALAIVGLGAATSASAASLSICDNAGSEGGCPTYGPAGGSNDPNILFSMNDFEGSFQINGVVVQSGLGSPATATVDEGAGPRLIDGAGENDFSGTWIDLGKTATVNKTIFFSEPGDPVGYVSDVLHYTYTTDGTFGHLDGSVLSDSGTSISVADLNAAGIFATGYASESTAYDFSNAFITAGFQSGVPEPAAWALMLLGVGAMGVSLRRRRQAMAAA